jgi:hypothetical protein
MTIIPAMLRQIYLYCASLYLLSALTTVQHTSISTLKIPFDISYRAASGEKLLQLLLI